MLAVEGSRLLLGAAFGRCICGGGSDGLGALSDGVSAAATAFGRRPTRQAPPCRTASARTTPSRPARTGRRHPPPPAGRRRATAHRRQPAAGRRRSRSRRLRLRRAEVYRCVFSEVYRAWGRRKQKKGARRHIRKRIRCGTAPCGAVTDVWAPGHPEPTRQWRYRRLPSRHRDGTRRAKPTHQAGGNVEDRGTAVGPTCQRHDVPDPTLQTRHQDRSIEI
jgi:hypothetical protein